MRQIPMLALTFVCVAASAAQTVAQTRASDTDQRAVELAAVSYIMQHPGGVALPAELQAKFDKILNRTPAAAGTQSPVWVGHNFVLEPRLFLAGVIQLNEKPPYVSVEPNIEPSEPLVPSHDGSHLQRLANALGIKTVLDDSKVCPYKFGEWLCRYASFDGSVQMGSAWIRENQARVGVRVATYFQPFGKSERALDVLQYLCALEKTSEWRVTECRIFTI